MPAGFGGGGITQQIGKLGDVLKELWGAGGPLNNLALAASERASVPAAAAQGLLGTELRRLARALTSIFLAPYPPSELEATTPRSRLAASARCC